MNEEKREKSLARKLVALLAATAVGLGLTFTGCAPQDGGMEDSEEPTMPEEPATPDEQEDTETP